MNTINYEIDITAPVGRVYEYYTNPDNIKKAWPQDIVKKSESVSGAKGEEGSEIKVEGEYMGREEEMILQVTDKEDSKRLVTEQKEGPFKFWKVPGVYEDQGNNSRHSTNTSYQHQENCQFSIRGTANQTEKVYNRRHKQ